MHTRRRSLAATLVLTLSACTPVESTVGSTAVTTSDAVTGPTDTGPSGSATEPTATPSPAPVTSSPVTSGPVTSAPEPPTTPVAPSDWPLALDLLSRCPALAGQGADTIVRLADLFHDVYPGPAWLNPIQPDLLGEALMDAHDP